MRLLVVGGNGQLGSRCCRQLAERGHEVRATVRSPERGAGLRDLGVDTVDIVVADVTSPEGLRSALADVECVVLSANSVAPRSGEDPARVDDGLLRLVDDAESAGVRRVVLPSVPSTRLDDTVPFVRFRRRLEGRLAASSMESVVLRLPPFMESWLALVGSSVPLRGEPFATVGRPSPFLTLFRRGTADLVERRGVMLVPGSPGLRNAFIALEDVAAACVAGVEDAGLAGAVRDVGGPEVLSWRQVAEVYSEVLGRRVRTLSTPAAVYAAAARALAPVATVPSRTMWLNHLLASSETDWSPGGGGVLDPAGMTSVRAFLAGKAALPARLPSIR